MSEDANQNEPDVLAGAMAYLSEGTGHQVGPADMASIHPDVLEIGCLVPASATARSR